MYITVLEDEKFEEKKCNFSLFWVLKILSRLGEKYAFSPFFFIAFQ